MKQNLDRNDGILLQERGDIILTIDCARYEAEQLQMAVYVAPEVNVPCAAKALFGAFLTSSNVKFPEEAHALDLAVVCLLKCDEDEEAQASTTRHRQPGGGNWGGVL